MKFTEEYRETSNSTVYNKARKLVLEAKGDIHCAYCRYHKGENRKRWTWKKPQSWKKHRKTQYKVVNVG